MSFAIFKAALANATRPSPDVSGALVNLSTTIVPAHIQTTILTKHSAARIFTFFGFIEFFIEKKTTKVNDNGRNKIAPLERANITQKTEQTKDAIQKKNSLPFKCLFNIAERKMVARTLANIAVEFLWINMPEG